MELVWLPDELYEVRTPLGDELIGIRRRSCPPSGSGTPISGTPPSSSGNWRAAATARSPRTRRRTAKHARHLTRLCHQGLELYTTGRLAIRLEDPRGYHASATRSPADPASARSLLADYEAAFAETRSVLPDRPDERPAEAWLRRVRAAFLP